MINYPNLLSPFHLFPDSRSNTVDLREDKADESSSVDFVPAALYDGSDVRSESTRDVTNLSAVGPNSVQPKKSIHSRRPTTPAPAYSSDLYREWVKGNSVANLVKNKLSASAEGRRLKQLKAQEDERRSLMFVRRMSGEDCDEFFDALGENDPVYRKLRRECSTAVDTDMDELL